MARFLLTVRHPVVSPRLLRHVAAPVLVISGSGVELEARPHQARHTPWRQVDKRATPRPNARVLQGPDIEDEVQMGVIPRLGLKCC